MMAVTAAAAAAAAGLMAVTAGRHQHLKRLDAWIADHNP
jgi:hypothetical protein